MMFGGWVGFGGMAEITGVKGTVFPEQHGEWRPDPQGLLCSLSFCEAGRKYGEQARSNQPCLEPKALDTPTGPNRLVSQFTGPVLSALS